MAAMAMQSLMSTSRLEIQEKASMTEAITAALGTEFERANKYKVFDDKGEMIFFAKESTDCCRRQIKSCFPDCAGWELDIYHTAGGGMDEAFTMTRDFTWTCCCINRPVVTMEGGGEEIGSIKDPCAWFGALTFSVRDAQENEVMTIDGGCCQPGLICPLPCGPCSRVDFAMTDAGGREVGNLTKKVPGCCSFCFASDVDNYELELGQISDPQLRALMMGAAIFIDFRYFNDNRSDNPSGMAEE